MRTENRQKEILKTALRIIHERGYKDLTVRNIADRIEISEPAIYRHFDNKEEIIRNLAKMVFEENYLVLDREEYENSYELLREILHRQFERLEENPYITAVLFQSEIFREYPEVERLFIEHRREKKDYLEKIVKKGQEKGHFSNDVDAETFALLFMGGVRMSALEWRNEEFSYSLTEEAGRIADELFKILKWTD
ncbi:hypothetical protein AKJ51_01235 [candidate division MSBL1 archaeon SCGC-AAA382A20]|uniref:HTH tetR-type domain-containing protein n=1 Tax=candidate division MSBL1 archaeon SCGC-AAA382A20 TaxID=1698280 RepID=A0A133VLV0_9EURY|nr:hypothetical protein AKJ51_01235 [candidate division MSBL1 archaeon SCGC-AAA382A20]